MHNLDILAPILFGTACLIGFAVGIYTGIIVIIVSNKKLKEKHNEKK